MKKPEEKNHRNAKQNNRHAYGNGHGKFGKKANRITRMRRRQMKILRRDGDHVLLASETRDGLAHSLEKTDGKWTCTCESANFGNPACKHVRWMEALERELIRRASTEYLAKK